MHTQPNAQMCETKLKCTHVSIQSQQMWARKNVQSNTRIRYKASSACRCVSVDKCKHRIWFVELWWFIVKGGLAIKIQCNNIYTRRIDSLASVTVLPIGFEQICNMNLLYSDGFFVVVVQFHKLHMYFMESNDQNESKAFFSLLQSRSFHIHQSNAIVNFSIWITFNPGFACARCFILM